MLLAPHMSTQLCPGGMSSNMTAQVHKSPMHSPPHSTSLLPSETCPAHTVAATGLASRHTHTPFASSIAPHDSSDEKRRQTSGCVFESEHIHGRATVARSCTGYRTVQNSGSCVTMPTGQTITTTQGDLTQDLTCIGACVVVHAQVAARGVAESTGACHSVVVARVVAASSYRCEVHLYSRPGKFQRRQ